MMQEETTYDGPVLAQYDVRGIQEYIFRSNRLKEIIGASYTVEQIFDKTLYQVINQMIECGQIPEVIGTNMEQYLLMWKENMEGYSFDSNKNIQMEILFANAGNATILFRSRKLCIAVNKEFTRFLLEHISGLSLAIGITEKTECYKEDYRRLVENLQSIKASMPVINMGGRFPIIKSESSTGLPLSLYSKERKEFVSIETFHKLESYQESLKSAAVSNDKVKNSKWNQFDQIIEEKGESSVLAIVHIDGNNMGNQIGSLMKEVIKYTDAVKKMKQISCNIGNAFNDKAFDRMISVLNEWIIKKEEINIPYQRYLRKIVNAGDDITFICTAKMALSLSKIYLEEVSKYSLTENSSNFSACAGIAIMHSHFPFYEGYKVAEACCKQAKERAKMFAEDKNLVGNWIDFQICKNMYLSNDFDKVRDAQYHLADETYLLKRPYMISTGSYPSNNKLEPYNFEQFTNQRDQLIRKEKISKHWLIELRNAYCEGEHEAYLTVNKIKASGFVGIKELYKIDNNNKKIAEYFDILEFLELYEDLELEEVSNESI